MCRYANVRLGATCFTCEYTTVPRMLSRSATANDSRVSRNVIANTRTGIPAQRGPPEFLFAMLLSYTISPEHEARFQVCMEAAVRQGRLRASPAHPALSYCLTVAAGRCLTPETD